jgi:transposase
LVGTEDEACQPRPGNARKAFGARLPKCTAQSFHHKAAEYIPQDLVAALGPVLETIRVLSERIREYDRKLEKVA